MSHHLITLYSCGSFELAGVKPHVFTFTFPLISTIASRPSLSKVIDLNWQCTDYPEKSTVLWLCALACDTDGLQIAIQS